MKNAMTVTSLWLTCERKKTTQKYSFTRTQSAPTPLHKHTHTHTYSKQIVESGQSFQEEVSTFVGEFVPSRDEEEQTFIQVEVKVPEGQTQ